LITTTITSLRSTLLAAMAAAVLLSPAGVCAAGPGQAEKEQAKGKDKTMRKTESGLQYRDVEEGTGEKLETGQTCVVHYTGWLWEGDAKGNVGAGGVQFDVPGVLHEEEHLTADDEAADVEEEEL